MRMLLLHTNGFPSRRRQRCCLSTWTTVGIIVVVVLLSSCSDALLSPTGAASVPSRIIQHSPWNHPERAFQQPVGPYRTFSLKPRNARRTVLDEAAAFNGEDKDNDNNDNGNSIDSTTAWSNTLDKNRAYVQGLLENLNSLLDKWMLTGNPAIQQRAYNILEEIGRISQDDQLIQQAYRSAQRAALPSPNRARPPDLAASRSTPSSTPTSVVATSPGVSSMGRLQADAVQRQREAEQRRQWEASRQQQQQEQEQQQQGSSAQVRSALGQRAASNSKPDILLGEVVGKVVDDIDNARRVMGTTNVEDLPAVVATANIELEQQLNRDVSSLESGKKDESDGGNNNNNNSSMATAAARVSQLVARAGAGAAFDPATIGIGGLDDVLAQVKRRVWIPLAAPPRLLKELGINPVRGLLLYGKPGCGKTLLARTLGRILSPLRPVTIVEGPEVMDKFVGSSEKNLRELFDNPPDIYDSFRLGEQDNGNAIAQAALHVIVLDEFDAIARTRGGRGGKGDQGDAGVARDSVVNQLLSKMDGIEPPVVPTLVIGLTNKRSLIEPALLRPGRFEVQIEVPPPRTVEQRVSILRVHTAHMQHAGRLLVRDAPLGTAAAAQHAQDKQDSGLLSYDELLESLAERCDGFSGATLAGVARAAASHALERAVEEFAQHTENRSLLQSCIVTPDDFDCALHDIIESLGDSDWAEDDDEVEEAPPTQDLLIDDRDK